MQIVIQVASVLFMAWMTFDLGYRIGYNKAAKEVIEITLCMEGIEKHYNEFVKELRKSEEDK